MTPYAASSPDNIQLVLMDHQASITVLPDHPPQEPPPSPHDELYKSSDQAFDMLSRPEHGSTSRQTNPSWRSLELPIILSILTMVFCGVFFGLAAFILAYVGRSSAVKGDHVKFRRMAQASYIVSLTGWVAGTVLVIILVTTLSDNTKPNDLANEDCLANGYNISPSNDGLKVCCPHYIEDCSMYGSYNDTISGCKTCCNYFNNETCLHGWKYDDNGCKKCLTSNETFLPDADNPTSTAAPSKYIVTDICGLKYDIRNCGNAFYRYDHRKCERCCKAVIANRNCTHGWRRVRHGCREGCCPYVDCGSFGHYYNFTDGCKVCCPSYDPDQCNKYGSYRDRDRSTGCQRCCKKFNSSECLYSWRFDSNGCQRCCSDVDEFLCFHDVENKRNHTTLSTPLAGNSAIPGSGNISTKYGRGFPYEKCEKYSYNYRADCSGLYSKCPALVKGICTYGWKKDSDGCRTGCCPYYNRTTCEEYGFYLEQGCKHCCPSYNIDDCVRYGSYGSGKTKCRFCCRPFNAHNCTYGWDSDPFTGCRECCEDTYENWCSHDADVDPSDTRNRLITKATVTGIAPEETTSINVSDDGCGGLYDVQACERYGSYVDNFNCTDCCPAIANGTCTFGWAKDKDDCRTGCCPYYNKADCDEYGFYLKRSCKICCPHFNASTCAYGWRYNLYRQRGCKTCCDVTAEYSCSHDVNGTTVPSVILRKPSRSDLFDNGCGRRIDIQQCQIYGSFVYDNCTYCCPAIANGTCTYEWGMDEFGCRSHCCQPYTNESCELYGSYADEYDGCKLCCPAYNISDCIRYGSYTSKYFGRHHCLLCCDYFSSGECFYGWKIDWRGCRVCCDYLEEYMCTYEVVEFTDSPSTRNESHVESTSTLRFSAEVTYSYTPITDTVEKQNKCVSMGLQWTLLIFEFLFYSYSV